MCDLCTMTATFDPKRHTDGNGFDGSMDGAIQATLYEISDASASRFTAYEMSVGDSFRGTLGWRSDRDWVEVSLTAGQSYEIALDGVSLSDPYLRLYDMSGSQIGYNDDGGPGLDSLLRHTATTTGTYYVEAGAFADYYTGSYTLSVIDAGSLPDTSGTLDELARFLTHGFWGGTSRSFNTSGSNQITVNITALTEDGQKLARWAFEAWEAVANIDFVEVSGTAQITFDDNASGAYASFSTSGSTLLSSNVNVGTSWLSTYGTTMSSYSFATYIHEIGHALGLGHQGDYNGSATYGIDDTYSNDSWQISVMSYFDQDENTTTNASRAALISAMMSDVVAIQNLYGAPGASSETAGNTTWGANSTLGGYLGDAMSALETSGNGSVSNRSVAFTIYDRDGLDTLDLSYNSTNDRVDLNDQSFSDVSGLTGNLAIARGTMIEDFRGGSGNDTVTGNEMNNLISGNDGHDSLIGGVGYDTLYGGGGGDSLSGGSGRDLVSGNTGDDSLLGGTGDDTLYGGDGNDTLFGNTALDTIYGEAGDDYISSGDGVDFVDGGAGNDTIYGRSGWDSLYGGDDDDTLFGSEGDDLLAGGRGDDWVSAGSAWDRVYGNSGNDTLYGNFGSDWISGGGGRDSLYGGTGDDTLLGGGGDDRLWGNQGVDRLDGGGGDDVMRGGTLADTFVFNTGYDRDEIADFELDRDTLLLSTSLTDGETDGDAILQSFGALVGADVVLDFGDGDTLILMNLASLSGLADRIDTF